MLCEPPHGRLVHQAKPHNFDCTAIYCDELSRRVYTKRVDSVCPKKIQLGRWQKNSNERDALCWTSGSGGKGVGQVLAEWE